MRSAFVVLAIGLLPVASALYVPTLLPFGDDFSRNDGNDVGNGWSETERTPGELRLSNGKVQFTGHGSDAVLHRPMLVGALAHPTVALAAPVTITMDIVGGATPDGRPNRINHVVTILDDGHGRGYGLYIGRSNDVISNSGIALWDRGVQTNHQYLPRQLPHEFTLKVTFEPDGSIRGSAIPKSGSPIEFGYGPRAFQADGNAVAVHFLSNWPSPYTTLDNFAMSMPGL